MVAIQADTQPSHRSLSTDEPTVLVDSYRHRQTRPGPLFSTGRQKRPLRITILPNELKPSRTAGRHLFRSPLTEPDEIMARRRSVSFSRKLFATRRARAAKRTFLLQLAIWNRRKPPDRSSHFRSSQQRPSRELPASFFPIDWAASLTNHFL